MFSIGIDKGYCKNTLTGLIGCAITSAIGLTTLVGTTSFFFFFFQFFVMIDRFLWHDLFFHSLNMLVVI
jgi:hypothetical protein